MTCVCASAICAEMTDWTRLGGGNSGCCADARHSFGFHLPAYAIPTSDYSRRHEAAAPYDMSWACAGDFAHNGRPDLRARHLTILTRLMNGELPMICEFIGQPWPGRAVYYWARWDGVTTLARYTGQGHDTWSHISWWRSRANERAYLYAGAPAPSPQPSPTPSGFPPWPGRDLCLGMSGNDVRVWQQKMTDRGWPGIGTVDGAYGPKADHVCRQFQQEKSLLVDGIVGRQTWDATWLTPTT